MKHIPFEDTSQRPRHTFVVWFDPEFDRMVCHYQDTKTDRKGLRVWLSTVATWFTDTQQEFLRAPSWDALNIHSDTTDLPLVNIDDFIKMIEIFGGLEPKKKFNTAEFKREIDNIELRWIEWSLNLGWLFSPEGKAQWILHQLEKQFPKTDFPVLAESLVERDRIEDIFDKNASDKTKIERCYQDLFAKVGGCRATAQLFSDYLHPKQDGS